MANGRVGILTGGGDTPALNATIYGITLAAAEEGLEVIGFRRGWAGTLSPGKKYEVVEVKDKKETRKPLEDPTGEYVILTPNKVNPYQGGSMILCSRTNLINIPGSLEDMATRQNSLGIDFFLPIGGEDTTSVTWIVTKRGGTLKAQIRAVPKTIDNDNGIIGPENVFIDFENMTNIWNPGFPSAARNAKVFSNLTYSTAYSHERVMWNEAMGRKAGFLALVMAELGLADMVLIPESPAFIEGICKRGLDIYKQKGFFYGVIAEGTVNAETGKPIAEDPSLIDSFGHAKLGGAAKVVAEACKKYFKENGVHVPYFTGMVPEYVYRGGPPTKLDRETAIALGYHALKQLIKDHKNGHMAVLMYQRGQAVPDTLPLEKAVNIVDDKIKPRAVPIDSNNVENGFYNPHTKNLTERGRAYARILGLRPIHYDVWEGEVHK